MKKLYKSSNIRVIVQKMRIKDIFDILLPLNGFTNLVNLVRGDYKMNLGKHLCHYPMVMIFYEYIIFH